MSLAEKRKALDLVSPSVHSGVDKKSMDHETALVEAVIEGSEAAFEELYTFYYPRLGRFLMRYVNSQSEAEDLIHNVFYQIWKNRERLKRGTTLRAYLFVAVRNQALKYLGRSQKIIPMERSYEEKEYIENPESDEHHIEYKEFEQQIKKLLKQVPEQRRRIFLMHREDELTYKEIAVVLGISIKTVETQISRTLKFLYDQVYMRQR
ncbi:RNA polymerase sigma-70 factor [Balneolaceae bacterium ANBcel3]|nr:RNA polymerase sigma-70 factor [Balneolaceae bacterium ANBcel3]